MKSFAFVIGVAAASMIEVIDDDNAKLSIKAEVMGADLMISHELQMKGPTANKAITSSVTVVDKVPDAIQAQIKAGEEPDDHETSRSSFLQVSTDIEGMTIAAFEQVCAPKGVDEDTRGAACGWTEVSKITNVDGTLSGSAKRPLDLENYTLKAGMTYTAIGLYLVMDMENEDLEVFPLQGQGIANIDLMDASGAMQSLAVAVTALIAITAF